MDIDRSILKALFYDYPIDTVVRLLEKPDGMQYDEFLDIMPQLMQWSKPEYTYTEVNLLRLQTGGEWQYTSNSNDKTPTIYHPFDILKKVSERFLTIENNQPILQFEQLFRWKESVLYVGEEMLVTAFLAQHDAKYFNTQHSLLLWDDIIKHNNHCLNHELDKGLTDLHAHYNATADIFGLNWICLMNNLTLRHSFVQKLQRSQEVELLPTQTKQPSSLLQQCIAAAYLRFVFYCILLNEQPIDEQNKQNLIETDYEKKVICILKDSGYASDFARLLQSSLSWALQLSLPTIDKTHLDYCLFPQRDFSDLSTEKQQKIANIIYHGERKLLYTFFYGYYRKDPKCVKTAPYFYLYLLIKSKIRREFVQINQIKGFENFETYQDRKDILIPYDSPIKKYYPYYVSHTSVNNYEKDRLEVRVTPQSIVKNSFDCNKAMFNFNKSGTDSIRPLDIVVHFIKKGQYHDDTPTPFNKVGVMYDGTRDAKYREDIRKQLNNVLLFRKNKNIVGIDAASREIFCRPETFGHVFRYAYQQGILGRTFHVGEDFLDLPDGLRAIDEAILFLQLNDKCRIGHAMALGIDAKEYYERRHYTTIITKQNLLDNCVWLYMRSKELNIKLAPSFEKLLLEKACELYHDIGYRISCEWNVQHYWHSLLLRGNDPKHIINHNEQHQRITNLWDQTAEVEDECVKSIKCDEKATHLYWDYFYNSIIKYNGLKLVQYKWKKEIVEVITQMQEEMRRFVSEKKISIECCPTSNLKIGYIDRYENHPLLTKFYPIDAKVDTPLIKSSINTDDRGVFYTSIYEEYSLIALALYKKRNQDTNQLLHNEREIIHHIAAIRQNAELMAFSQFMSH